LYSGGKMMPETPSMTSSEIGAIWITYQQKTMLYQMLDYFINNADDHEAREIMSSLRTEIQPFLTQMVSMFEAERIPIPIGFVPQDVNKDAPKLYDNGFDIMFVRLVKEISSGMHTINLTMVYREDIILLFRELTKLTQKYYDYCTRYLLGKGLLPRAPYVTVEKSVEFVKSNNYLDGAKMFSEKRPLNTVEIAHLYRGIETNVIGMNLIFGFAQVAKEKEAKKYFNKGGELAKSFIKDMSEVLHQNNIQVPSTAGGNITDSTVPPFSDKIMMYCISLFCSFSLGSNSIGTAFSLRNDLPLKLATYMKDIFEYAHEGAKIMIKNGWMEEPPQTIK
jgi:hypothetical protein